VPQLLAIGAAHVPFEIGGGIRDLAAIQEAFEAGAARVILGTAAYHLPQLVEAAAKQFPGKIAVAIDARAGKVALQGWQEITSMEAVEFARVSERAGASRIIYTDILSDGMMEGPNLEATEAVARAVNIPVTASGGISSLDDVRALRSLEEYGVDEAIIGRALYLGRFTLAEAMAAAQEAP
jgi:phosphoribosylformimino-5-aminoimidazole carboxamide ribotide isomerase